MGKQIKSTALTLDGSSMGAAPVSPTGTVRLRPKTDASALEVSYNGAAYVTLSGGGSGSTPRLDEVLDPTLNSTFAMGVYNLEFTYTGSTGVNDFIIQSAPSASGAGSLLFVRTQATTSTKSPFRVEANDTLSLMVLANGSTLIGNTAAQTLTNTALSGTISYFDQNLTISPASNSTTEHRLLDQGVTFGTAFNASSLRLRYAAIDHNVAATLSSFYIDNVTYTQSAGTTTTLNGYSATLNVNSGTSSTVIGSATSINAAGGTISSSIGFYSLVDRSSGTFTQHIGFKLFASGTIGTLYGCVMPSGSLSGFGIDPPTATLHASGTVRLDLSSDARGDVFYRASTGNLSRLAIGTSTQVLTVTDIGGGVLEPRWGAAPGGGSSPGGSASELQYRAGASTFGAVSNSAVSGANITLGGTFTMDAAGVQDQSIAATALTASDTKITFTEYKGAATPILLQFDRSRGSSSVPANLSSADIIGELKFRGRVSGAFAQQAYIRAAWDSTDGGALQMGAGATSGSGTRFVATVNSGAGIFDTGGNFFAVSGSGFQFSHGSTGSIYYRDALGLFTALTIGSTSTYLKGGTIPSWGGLDAGHVTAGTLPLARGGTASSLVDPGADRILFWDDSVGVVDWLTVSTGLLITGTTLTATAGGSPGGSATEIQYRSGASTFGAVTSSSVSGADVTWAGFQIQTFTHTTTSGTFSIYDFNLTISPASASSSTYRYIDCGATFGTAQNLTGAIRLLYGILDHNQNASISSFKGTEIGFTKSVGNSVTTVVGHDFTSSINTGTSSSVSGVTSSINAAGGTITSGVGYYAAFDRSSGTLTAATGFRMFTSGTIGTVYGVRLPLGSLNGLGIDAPLYAIDVAGSTASTNVVGIVSRSDWQSTGTPAAGFGQANTYTLESSTTATQLAAQMDVRWQVATHASRSAVMSLRTLHKASAVANERMIIGGYKDWVDNTLTDLFTVTFVAADQLACGGEIHLLFVAKQVTGGAQTQIYRRKLTFIAGHNAATNTSMFNVREDSGAQASAASTGSFTTITHAINSDSAVALATAIPTNPNVIATNVITYKMLVDSSLTTISQFSCYYHIIYHGELDITLA